MYVEELIGPDTVNTLPPKTMAAFKDHGVAENRLHTHLEQAHRQLSSLADLGIPLNTVTDQLEVEGIESFVQAFNRLLAVLDQKRSAVAP